MTFQTTPTLNRNKFLFTGFFRALERKIDVDMADFTLGRKQWEILRHTSDNLNWFVGLALGTKFPPPPPPPPPHSHEKKLFYSWHVMERLDAADL